MTVDTNTAPTMPTIVYDEQKKVEHKYLNLSSGGLKHILETTEGAPTGRKTWRKIN